MLAEFAVAFVLILMASSLVYLLGRRASSKSEHTENSQSTYACGEKATSKRLTINVSLYKYLIYFITIDSSVLLLAFASPGFYSGNAILLTIYLLIIATSSLMLVKGRDHKRAVL